MKYKIEMVENAGNGIWNEDRVIINRYIIGVIDGATPIHKFKYQEYSTIAEWLVASFIKKIPYEYSGNYKKICRDIINELSKNEYIKSIDECDKPCFTSATIMLNNGKMECQVIGDSYIYIQKKNGIIEKIADNRVDIYANKTVNAIKKARKCNEDIIEAIEKQKIENRKKMNVEGGYWVVGFKGEFEKEFVERMYNIAEVEKVLICTDGFERIMKEFAIVTIEQLMNEEMSLNEAIKLLRNYENAQYQNKNYQCVKKSDDATVVKVKFI